MSVFTVQTLSECENKTYRIIYHIILSMKVRYLHITEVYGIHLNKPKADVQSMFLELLFLFHSLVINTQIGLVEYLVKSGEF